VDATAAAEAAVALASLVDTAALEAHFEEQYLQALRTALKARTDKK
jgi:quinol monooxygenase YgiN